MHGIPRTCVKHQDYRKEVFVVLVPGTREQRLQQWGILLRNMWMKVNFVAVILNHSRYVGYRCLKFNRAREIVYFINTIQITQIKIVRNLIQEGT